MTGLAELAIDPGTPGFSLRPDYYEVLARLRAEAPVFEYAPGIKTIARYHASARSAATPRPSAAAHS